MTRLTIFYIIALAFIVWVLLSLQPGCWVEVSPPYPLPEPYCGNGYCEALPGNFENDYNCPEDCYYYYYYDEYCGDGYCSFYETERSCPEDCGYYY